MKRTPVYVLKGTFEHNNGLALKGQTAHYLDFRVQEIAKEHARWPKYACFSAEQSKNAMRPFLPETYSSFKAATNNYLSELLSSHDSVKENFFVAMYDAPKLFTGASALAVGAKALLYVAQKPVRLQPVSSEFDIRHLEL